MPRYSLARLPKLKVWYRKLTLFILIICSSRNYLQREFAEIHKLSFTLLSDAGNKISKQFGVPKNLLGLLPVRVTLVADINGKVIYLFNSQTQATKHMDEAVQISQELK